VINSTIKTVRLFPTHCGANLLWAIIHSPVSDSSPHTWGKRRRPGWRYVYVRFIPTHVGKTQFVYARHLYKQIHPHIRGANLTKKDPSIQTLDSSPRTWGKRFCSLCRLLNKRFIPTYVGYTYILYNKNTPDRSRTCTPEGTRF